MTLDAAYWCSLADDYLTAHAQAFPSAGGIASEPSHRNAIVLSMAVAEHETNNGRAWPNSYNFGAVQLRGLTPAEGAAFRSGTLKAGDYNADRSGVLHVDTHPPGVPYPMWFAAFPTRVLGVAHFLKTLYRLSESAPEAPDATAASVSLEMYCGHYFEGRHIDDRPWVQRRPKPLDAPEQANVDEYARSVQACRDTIEPMLAGWDYGRDEYVEVHDTLPPTAEDPDATLPPTG